MLHDVVQRKKFYTLVLQKCLTRSVDGDVKLVADTLQIKPLLVALILAIPVLLGLILFTYVSTSSFIQKRKVNFEEYDGLNYRMDGLHAQVVSAMGEDMKRI